MFHADLPSRPKWYFKVEALCLTLFVHTSPTVRKLAFRLASALAKDGNSTSESDGHSNDALGQNGGETYVADADAGAVFDVATLPKLLVCFVAGCSSAFVHEKCLCAG